MLESKSLTVLSEALSNLEKGFNELPGIDVDTDLASLRDVMQLVAEKMKDNYPYFHPLYAGQMLKPPHPIARIAYMLAMWINPNNHAMDGGRASSEMEKEAVAEIAAMFGWDVFLGHLSSGGTMANLEALWVAGKLCHGKTILASDQAHYTHSRISDVLGLSFSSVTSDQRGRMDINALEETVKNGNVGTVVATLGTTGSGAIDPLAEILALKEKYGFRVHVDSAYGGYFTLADNLNEQGRSAFDAVSQVDSIVVDPHKHGLQPYGCGCVLFKDPDVGRLYKHDSPYTYFSSAELHLGEISLECSRAGASAVALWATQKLLPMSKGGEFALSLGKSRNAALDLYSRLKSDDRFKLVMEPDLDIVIWAIKAESCSKISELSQKMFDLAAEKNLHLALFSISTDSLDHSWEDIALDCDSITCMRSCLMKPEHEEWMDQIWKLIDQITNEIC
ncbi:MAG: pyridoxal phosphate-dependent decarboxylase family protein [Desulforhopalus sp.]